MPDLANPKSLDSYINKYADDMLRLALFLNIPFVIKDMDNEFYIADRKITAHELWELISERINLDPVYPNVGNPFGMFYKSGKFESVIPSVAFRHIHMALMACSITKNIEPASIMEIGGGFGGVLFYIAKLLKKSIALQSIDIPEINVISAYFLSKALPDVKIILYGENTNTGGNAISIQPNWVLKEIPPDSVSLVINTDSFPEMPEMTMLEYLGRIAEISRYFYSVNQDCGRGGQNRLSQTDTEKLGLECINYNIAWMRRGYFERLYRRKPVKDARAT
ncbi:MAG: putative sugar O-methyltransferase [Nitrospiraceae bacterium]|nr:putative sugar O-methyltransferase [Nitrospiraceae bacterium]